MWLRNLVFLGVVAAALAALQASLFPLYNSGHAIGFDPGPATEDDFQSAVRRVNESFRRDWETRGLTSAPLADDLTVARRLSLALTGSIPSLEEIRQFETRPASERLDGWALHLLQDRRHADYFADRLARIFVGTDEGPFLVYRKQRLLAWLSDELGKNTSYGEIVRQLIASQGLNTDTPAVNFIAAAFDDDKKAPNADQLAIRVTRAFLGLRLDCVQCHDDFLNTPPQWEQTHFQSLAAFFGQTRHVATHVADGDGEYEVEVRKGGGEKRVIDPAVPFLPELLPEEGTRRERLARWVTHPRNVHFARGTVNRVWAMLFNRPLLPRVHSQSLTDEAPAALDILAEDFAKHDYDLRRLILLIAATDVFRLNSAAPHDLTEEHDRAWAVFPLTRLRPETVIGSVLQAASTSTINQNSNVIVRLTRYFNERDFVKRYGDSGDDDFENRDGTIPQRLLMMNGSLVTAQARGNFATAAGHVAMFAPDDRAAVEAAFLTVLTRRPTAAEADHFTARLAGSRGDERKRRLSDLFWVLFNSTELSILH